MLQTIPSSTLTERAAQIQAAVATQRSFGDVAANKVENFALRYNKLLELQKESDEEYGPGRRVASDEVWQDAWAEKEEYYRLQNIRRESHSDPTPLLMDKASTLPPGSPERLQAEIVKGTIDNTIAGVGQGLDTLTRESYKETKRLVKHSDMLQEGANEPLPSSDQIVGEEEGQVVSNLQSWKPALANATKPVSDAMGSSADTRSSIAKGPMGADQFMPASAAAMVDNITPHFANQVDASFKAVQMDSFQHAPAKSAGSIRNLTTSSDPSLSVPFEIASDVYGGLLNLMNEVADLGDIVMNGINRFNLSPAGGLTNGLVPFGLLGNLLGSVKNIAKFMDGLNQMMGGFDAIANIAGAIAGIASDLSYVLNDASKLASMFAPGANVARIVGGSAGRSLGCSGSQLGLTKTLDKIAQVAGAVSVVAGVLGNLDHVHVGRRSTKKGLGNLGAVIGGGISMNIGRTTPNLRMPEQILPGILPPELALVMEGLDAMPGLGLTGNGGFSAGTRLDGLNDHAFAVGMSTHAAHAAILGPNFNKQTRATGSYAQESSLDTFRESQYVRGAQGSKGVTMLGPGSTASQKVFGKI